MPKSNWQPTNRFLLRCTAVFGGLMWVKLWQQAAVFPDLLQQTVQMGVTAVLFITTLFTLRTYLAQRNRTILAITSGFLFATLVNGLTLISGGAENIWIHIVAYAMLLVALLVAWQQELKRVSRVEATITGLKSQLKEAIDARRDAETAEHAHRRLSEAMHDIGLALSTPNDFDELLEQLLDQISRVLPYDTANIMQVSGNQISIVCTRGYEERAPYAQQFTVDEIPSLRQMITTRQPVIIPDTANHPLWVRPETSPHVRSWAGAPIFLQNELVAFLALNFSEANFYTASDVVRLEAFAGQAAIALQNARLYEQLQKRFNEQTTLNTISQSIASTLDLQETLTIITDHTTKLMQVDATSVALLDKEQGDLWFAAASGAASEFVIGKRLPMGQGILGWVTENGEPLLVTNVTEDERYYPDFDEQSGFQAKSLLCVPLKRLNETIGAIEIINKKTGRFDDDDIRLLTLLANPAATAIENARLYDRAQREIDSRAQVEQALEAERALLARRVEERTADLSAANAELARAARLKDEFLASISHELRTPLNAVLGISEALQEEVYGPLNEKQSGSLRSIEESGRHLLSLINDILDLSKVEAGKLELEIRPFSLESVCQASLRLIRQNAHKKELTVHAEFDEQVTTIYADERRVKQVLVNLLSNAVKFTPQGGEIGLRVTGDFANRRVNIMVWDTGIGISADDMTRLFRPFVQLDSRLSREYAGTGLGLSLVYRMVELHGGHVSVDSRLGEGSEFSVSLPWQGPEATITPADEADLVAADAPSLLTLRRALIVEDSPTTTAQLIRYLTELGMETITHTEGYGVVEKALIEQPDVILLDLMLPDRSGWDVLHQLKSEPPTQQIPVLVISVLEEGETAVSDQIASRLVKPFSRQQLQTALRQVVAGQIEQKWTRLMEMANQDQTDEAEPPHILLVEDNEANIATIGDYLTAKSYQLTVARNGEEAMRAAQSVQPDMILMDIQLPGKDGLTVIREMRQIETLKETPIIAVTALAMPGDREACLKAGANGYLSKPVVLRELVLLITSFVTQPPEMTYYPAPNGRSPSHTEIPKD